MFRVEQNDPELLDRPRPKGGYQVPGGVVRRQQLDAGARRVRQCPAAQLERRKHLSGFGRSNACDPGQVGDCRSHQTMDATARAEKLIRQTQRPDIPEAAAQHQREQLVVAQRGGAVTKQFFSRSIVGRQVFHRATVRKERVYFE